MRAEVDAYLAGARTLLAGGDRLSEAGAARLGSARRLFAKAAALYHGYVQRSNRFWYVGGVLASAFAAAAVAPLAVFFSALGLRRMLAHLGVRGADVFGAVDLPALLVLFGFAGLGSVVSVLSRLDRLEVPQVFTKRLIVVSGVGRPLVAAVFATVVYAIVSAKIVNLAPPAPGSPHPEPIHAGTVAHWWCVVVAFLCGYSERFASDLLGQAPFGRGPTTPEAPAAPGMSEPHRG